MTVKCNSPNSVICQYKRNLDTIQICGIDADAKRCKYAEDAKEHLNKMKTILGVK